MEVSGLQVSGLQVSGLQYYDLELGQGILEALDAREWKAVTSAANSRTYQHYGFTYNYAAGKVGAACEPIPEFLKGLQEILTEKCGVEDYFNQCIVNNYMPGQGISKHIDHRAYGDIIGCFTLESGAMMNFHYGKDTVSIYTRPNSLYVMSGDARYKWAHEMPARKSDIVDGLKIPRGRRVSVTFRHV